MIVSIQVSNLRGMIDGPDYKEKLGSTVTHLYKLAFETYKDIPRGPVKVVKSNNIFLDDMNQIDTTKQNDFVKLILSA